MEIFVLAKIHIKPYIKNEIYQRNVRDRNAAVLPEQPVSDRCGFNTEFKEVIRNEK